MVLTDGWSPSHGRDADAPGPSSAVPHGDRRTGRQALSACITEAGHPCQLGQRVELSALAGNDLPGMVKGVMPMPRYLSSWKGGAAGAGTRETEGWATACQPAAPPLPNNPHVCGERTLLLCLEPAQLTTQHGTARRGGVAGRGGEEGGEEGEREELHATYRRSRRSSAVCDFVSLEACRLAVQIEQVRWCHITARM